MRAPSRPVPREPAAGVRAGAQGGARRAANPWPAFWPACDSR